MRIVIAQALLIALCCSSAFAGKGWFSGKEPDAWADNSVVYGEVISVAECGRGTAKIELRILVTLAGRVDAAREYVIDSVIGYGCTDIEIEKPPPAKSRCIAHLIQHYDLSTTGKMIMGRPVISGELVPFMPKQASIVVVSGLDDPKAEQIIARLRDLRATLWPTSATTWPQKFDGEEENLWEDHSIVFAEVAEVTDLEKYRATINLNIKAAITGRVDPALDSRVPFRIAYGHDGTAIKELPKAKSRVLVVLRRMSDRRLAVSDNYFLFMPDKSPITVVSGLDDPKVKQIISRLRELRKPRPADPPWK